MSLANGGFGQHIRHDSAGINPEMALPGCGDPFVDWFFDLL